MPATRCAIFKWPFILSLLILTIILFTKAHSRHGSVNSHIQPNAARPNAGSNLNPDEEQPEDETTASRIRHKLSSLTSFLPFASKKPYERLAYVTFLSESDRHEAQHAQEALNETLPDLELDMNEVIDEKKDRYFIAARMLGYQLMHDPKTRTQQNIPYIVLVTDDVTPYKRYRLQQDGAVVIPVADVAPLDWATVGFAPWKEVFTKLRAWELEDVYDRALFIDVDHILTRPLDTVFNEPATLPVYSLNGSLASPHPDEAPLPPTYVFASMPEVLPDHHYPPTVETNDFKGKDYFNAGFFVFAPDKRMFEYYVSVMGIKDRFDPQYPEQGLLNYAHRLEGGIPWRALGVEWDVHFPNVNDREGGVASVHDKWWGPERDPNLKEWYSSVRWAMEGFYEGWDRNENLQRSRR